MKHINYNEQFKNDEISDNQKIVEEAGAVELMINSEGWQIVEKNLRNQLEAYIVSNSTEATDWDNYKKIAGKISGIQLLLVDIEDYIRKGQEAADVIKELKKY